MDTRVLGELCKNVFDDYLAKISRYQRDGMLESAVQDPVLLYPRSLEISTTKWHHIVELTGVATSYRALRLAVNTRPTDFDSYLSQFRFENVEGEPAVDLNVEHAAMISLSICRDGALEGAEQRFPGFKDMAKTILKTHTKLGEGPLIRVGPQANYATFEDVMLHNSYRGSYRTRYIRYMLILSKRESKDAVRSYLNEEIATRDVRFVQTATRGSEQVLLNAAQFASYYLRPNRETQIGAYLNEHPELLKSALATDYYIYEPYLEWQPGTHHGGDKAINPDLMTRRQDGYYDIYDLKLPLLGKKVTKGERRRRRFVDSVSEGAAQLAHYEEYFEYPENALHAKERYGIEVSNPRCALIVGNRENIAADEIDEALRAYRNLTILDYDTLVRLYVANAQ